MRYILPVILLSLLSCESLYKVIDFRDFKSGKDQLYTQDLKHYTYAMNYWLDFADKKLLNHFPSPEKLLKKNDHKLFFAPTIMQGGSLLVLTTTFPTLKEAEKYINNYPKQKAEISLNGLERFRQSNLCYTELPAFRENQESSQDISIRLLNPTWCASGSSSPNKKLGGIQSGMALISDKRQVVCWVVDGRN